MKCSKFKSTSDLQKIHAAKYSYHISQNTFHESGCPYQLSKFSGLQYENNININI